MNLKHGGNVHERGIVTITSKSVDEDPESALANVADLAARSLFISRDEPGQWICWDFGGMRIRLTLYTVIAHHLKSWVVEGSVDGKNWVEIDRQANNEGLSFRSKPTSFPVSNPADFRCIRLTQTGRNPNGRSMLCLPAVDFFGTLFP
jgi:hypothetical protein